MMRIGQRLVIFVAALGLGALVFGVGFRLTDEVLLVLPALMLCGACGGLVCGSRAWVWGVGLALGVALAQIVAPAPPYVPDARHAALFGSPQPLPLPFGLTGSETAQHLAGAALIGAFPLAAALVGWALRAFGQDVLASARS